MNKQEQLHFDIENIFNKKFPENKLIKVFAPYQIHYETENELSIINNHQIEKRCCQVQTSTN